MNRCAIGGVFALACLLCGCVFAPPTYGPRRIVSSNDYQYQQYLQYCRKSSIVLDDACKKWGNPVAIKIGNSGGYFVWQNPRILYSVGSFGSTKVTSKIPRDICAFLGESPVKTNLRPANISVERVSTASYEIDKLERVQGEDFAYVFEITSKSALSLADAEKIKKELRQTFIDDYRATYGVKSGVSLQVDFPEYSIAKDKISGKSVVMQLTVLSLEYNAERSTGVIRVKMGAYSFEEVRRIVRRNIENIVRDKNIALSTGEIPPETRFCIGNERVTGEGIMEIEFEAL